MNKWKYTEADVLAGAKELAKKYDCDTELCRSCKDKDCHCRDDSVTVLKAVGKRRAFYAE